ncbi:hypothetical protein GCM10010124_01650 [Pilimelia terevasa]|uniref:Histidine kinase domain-containing protein n=1 Tax=Pilimelia terevasa TaxID=53372 RepID=A0A8J3FE55_9ACTN|nr:histidine kinase [Pilimelia terevasa]GGK12775.1 hypothetical protein GCM10010124_01650 [Pilimelia terevasa]
MSETTVAVLLDRLHRCQVDERRRIARELHDVIAPTLAVVLHDLELFGALRHSSPARAEAKLEAAAAHLRAALDQLRGVTAALRRDPGTGALGDELRAYLDVAGFSAPTRLHLPDSEPPLPRPVRGELFLILREALRNAHRHGRPTVVDVTITADDGQVLARVRDDGAGFDPAAVPASGIGIVSMRERAAACGGTLVIRPRSGGGTEVAVAVPLSEGDG